MRRVTFQRNKKIKPKRKKQIDSLIYSFLEKLNFQVNLDVVFNDINAYQKKNEDYFSYAEINYIFILFRVILIKMKLVVCRKH